MCSELLSQGQKQSKTIIIFWQIIQRLCVPSINQKTFWESWSLSSTMHYAFLSLS